MHTGTDGFVHSAGLVVLFATPALIGIFWGAPLISRELETGTCRLAWTQSISRTRWLAVKLGVTGLAGIATAGLLSLMVTWRSAPIDQLNPYGSRFAYQTFGTRDLTQVGYAAIAITLAVFAAVQVAVPL